MKIIVTGCRGQLGTEIIKQLREGRSELGLSLIHILRPFASSLSFRLL